METFVPLLHFSVLNGSYNTLSSLFYFQLKSGLVNIFKITPPEVGGLGYEPVGLEAKSHLLQGVYSG